MFELVGQLIVLVCFIGIVVVLFYEKKDYITYSVLFMMIAVVATSLIFTENTQLENFILAINWRVIIFLISMFIITEILTENLFFAEIAHRIVTRYHDNVRKMFWVICLTSTLSAAVIEDVSVALIFIPIVVNMCRRLEISPAPFMLGITICINLASTLSPFASAQNILIAQSFNLDMIWFFQKVSVYFIISTFTTLYLLDRFILRRTKVKWTPECDALNSVIPGVTSNNENLHKNFNKNLIGFAMFVIILISLPDIALSGIIGMLLFVFINHYTDPVTNEKRASLSRYISKIDYKLVYFFICLFLMIYCMEVNGTIAFLEHLVSNLASGDIFALSIMILIISSLFSGFLDNVPVTIALIPIITTLAVGEGFYRAPMLIAFIIGVNIGGNFLPQGAACDMATLEFATKYCVTDLNYKRLTKVGGLFALLHVALGIGYLALWILLFP